MKLQQQQAAFARDIAKLIAWTFEQGFSITLGEAYRTPEQAEIYAKSGKGIKDSLHCKRLAMDLNLFNASGNYLSDSKDYEKLGAYWESLDPLNKWGGRFKDGNHFQRDLV